MGRVNAFWLTVKFQLLNINIYFESKYHQLYKSELDYWFHQGHEITYLSQPHDPPAPWLQFSVYPLDLRFEKKEKIFDLIFLVRITLNN